MLLRAWPLAVALLLATAFAGCVKNDDEPPVTTTPDGGTPPTGTSPTSPTDGGGDTPPPPPPQTQPVEDSGAIQGEFEKSWNLNVPQVSPRVATVSFALSGAQEGAPVTAHVFLEFVAPDGTVLKTANLGLGGSGDKVDWTFGPADLPATGDYVIRATADPSTVPAGLPSGGVANYQLYALVEY